MERFGILCIALFVILSIIVRHTQAVQLETSVRNSVEVLNNSTTEIDVDFENEIPNAMIWVSVQATRVMGVNPNRPSVVDVALLYYPPDSDTSVLVMSAPMTFENNNDRFIRQTFATCSSVYAATLNRFVNVGTKLGKWEAVISRAQNANQLSAFLSVTIGAMTGQLSQSQTAYTGIVPSSLVFFDIPNSASTPQDVSFTITANTGSLSWLKLASFRSGTCPVFTPFGVPDASQINTPISTTNSTLTIQFRNVTADWHVAIETDFTTGQSFTVSWVATDTVRPVIFEPFWDTENIILAVLFSVGLLIVVVGLGVAIYWYNVRFSKREEYESL